MRLIDSLDAVPLDQLHDAAKTALHIGRQRVEFISNSTVEQFYDPRGLVTLLQF